MKKMIFAAALMMVATGLKAQDCDALVLPWFGNDRVAMEKYKAEAPYKFEWRCAFAQAAFYEADSIPEGAEVFKISEVKNKFTGAPLNANYRVDLATLSYYAYTFFDFQLRYPTGDQTLCFATPGSEHPYLVLRSTSDMHALANEMMSKTDQNR